MEGGNARVKRAWLEARRMLTENRRNRGYCVTIGATSRPPQEVSITLFNIPCFALLS